MPTHDQASQGHQEARGVSTTSERGPAGEARAGPAGLPRGVAQRARWDPAGWSAAEVLRLQRTIGNQAVGSLLAAGRPGLGHGPSHAQPSETAIHRRLILNGQERAQADDAQADLGADFVAMRDTVQQLIDLPGLPVKVTTAELREVDAYRTRQQIPQGRGAKVATLQLLSHGAWTQTATVGKAALPTLNVFNSPDALKNLAKLGEFLEQNPNVGENLGAAGVGWELGSRHGNIHDFGGGAVIKDRVHIAEWVLQEKDEGFMRMVVHETGHATFQRMLITGENWSEETNRGTQRPDNRALEADGKTFYEAWEVIRQKPRYFYITDMPGDAADAKGAGRGDYLAKQFTEFCAESFMHLALKKAELQDHVARLPDHEAAVKAAWQSALSVLLKYESQILGRQAGGGTATLIGHQSNLAFMAVIEKLKEALNGLNLQAANIDEAKKNLLSLRRAWQGLLPADRARHRSAALTVLDDYLLRVQGRRPAQAHLGSELGFAGL